tara:strand:- start:290 stop:412 length:123 start_codon:yes stop_codon:yes gene_type:complete
MINLNQHRFSPAADFDYLSRFCTKIVTRKNEKNKNFFIME